MNELKKSIVWRKPHQFQSFSFDDAKKSEHLENFIVPNAGLARALSAIGVPEVYGAATPKEDVLGLLNLAAEVEHALMVQYLYAAMSVRGIPSRKISHIAVQEMGHLVTVNNLILSLRGLDESGLPIGLHLGRDENRNSSSLNPLPFVLEQVTRTALAKFVVVERPGVIEDDALRARVEGLESDLALGGVDPNPVYALYAAIRWIFQKSDTESELTTDLGLKPGWHLSDDDFIEPTPAPEFAAEPIEWGSLPGLIVAPVTNRAEALLAVDEIAEQGEGASASDESHFQDFLTVLDSFEAGQFDVKTLPRSPYVAELGTPEDSQAVEVSAPYTVLWAKLFAAIYELLLLEIGWSLSLPRSGADRRKMIDVSVDTMRRLLQPTADHLATLPLVEGSDEVAGPTYQLLDETLPDGKSAYAARFAKVLSRRDRILVELKARPEFPTDITGFLVLSRIEPIDQQRAPLLP